MELDLTKIHLLLVTTSRLHYNWRATSRIEQTSLFLNGWTANRPLIPCCIEFLEIRGWIGGMVDGRITLDSSVVWELALSLKPKTRQITMFVMPESGQKLGRLVSNKPLNGVTNLPGPYIPEPHQNHDLVILRFGFHTAIKPWRWHLHRHIRGI